MCTAGNVNNGGEALSDGDIHVYGKLLGRVICGLKGDSNGKIYCRSFEPALVGISDTFVVVEDHLSELRPVLGRPVCVSYHADAHTAQLQARALRSTSTSNDSSSSSHAMEPAVKISTGGESYLAFTVLST